MVGARQVLDVAARLPLQIGAHLEEFLTWSTTRNCSTYVSEQRRYLTWWRAQLAGVDLHQLELATVEVALIGALSRQQRIAALKRYVSYLVTVRRALERDPVAMLKVPQTRPAQWRGAKARARGDVLRTLAELVKLPHQHARLAVLCGTGWHLTELVRFAQAGRLLRRGRRLVLETVHKSGELHRTQVSARVFSAAERVRAFGAFKVAALRRAVWNAARRAGQRGWTPGCLRHSVATYAVDAGAHVRSVADFLGHKDPRTTRRFYATHAVPQRVPTLL